MLLFERVKWFLVEWLLVRLGLEGRMFWLIDRFMYGARRCIIVGKYPSKVENLKAFEG